MPLREHPAYNEEKKRLAYTRRKIENYMDLIKKNKEVYKDNIREAFTVLDYLDSSQSYISILTNAKFIELDSNHLEELQGASNKPYFGRIDCRVEDSESIYKFYIGKVSLLDRENKKILILDWRAPIASIYYEGRLGDVSYETPQGTLTGDLLLKRQFIIDDGKLENILDIDITTNDTFLQAFLESNADKRLKDIAATIQAEQNRIIRADMQTPLIVQGVAGSGKTTIALHRAAYLIYTYEESFIPENFMIIAPNRLFLDYISDVLPELGVEKVKQTTLMDLLKELLGDKYKLVDPNEKLISFIDQVEDEKALEKNRHVKWSSYFKGAMAFKDIINRYVRKLEQDFIPADEFSLEDHIIMSSGDLRRLFIDEYKHLPLYKRINEVKKHLTFKLKSSMEKIIEEKEKLYSGRFEVLRSSIADDEERRAVLTSLIDAKNAEIENIKRNARTLVAKYLARFPKYDLFYYYKDIVTREDNIKKYAKEKLDTGYVKFMCESSTVLLNKKHFEIEDGAALVYLKHKLFGFEQELDIKNVVIDEAQDFSAFQLYTLKEILGTGRFTMFGDLAQGIHSYRGINDWKSVAREVFPEGCNYLTLEQSYRTTIEIMNTANEILKKHMPSGSVLAKPVIRHGEKPDIQQIDSAEEIISSVKEQIKNLQAGGYKSIALICKSMDECKRVKKYFDLDRGISVRLLTGEEDSYKGGVMLVPSYVAKGLEFDVVFIIAIEDKYSSADTDVKLLYVAMTRALHKLYVYYKQNTIPFFDSIVN
jgi:DNA helicase II / ATP-dependent DNA helicase PcrA